MIKKLENVFITGDLHLGDVIFKDEDNLIKIIKENKFSCLVFGGDTFDPWRGKSIKDLIADYGQLFKYLQNLKSKVVFIKGNHDQDIEFLQNLGFEVAEKFEYLNGQDKKVKIIHGHEFDSDYKAFEFLTKKVARCEEFINEQLQKISNKHFVRFLRLLNDFDLKRIWKNFNKDFKKMKDVDVLLFGHTHVPWQGEKEGVKIINWGGWQRDFDLEPNYIIDNSGEIKTITLK